ncbi:MAG: hypothetical protein H8E55_17040 [Pelagibacterales bacterium]|nr:hypothetical protein [Pelagibacterales bacterium]
MKKYNNLINQGKTLDPSRNETDSERIERYMFLYENGDKPPHYDNPLINKIDSYQDYGKLREKAAVNQDNSNFKNGKPVSKEFIRDAYPKDFENMDKNTYPSTGKPQAKIQIWDLIKQTAKTPFEQREIRDILNKEYKKDRKRLEPDELRLINRHPDQIKAQVEAFSIIPNNIIKPILRPTPTPTATVDVYDVITKSAQMKPGLSEDFIKLQSDINKNIKYVLGSADQKDESKERRIEILTQEKEEINND